MGLNFNHDRRQDPCPSWSYLAFNRFRTKLATAEGIQYTQMQGFGLGDIHPSLGDPGTRSWDEVTSILKPLLTHSDCEGHLTPEECAQLYPRLREIVNSWDGGPDKPKGLRLADCMQACAEEHTRLEFR